MVGVKPHISLAGYDLLGNEGKDGVRYAWKCDMKSHMLESAAFQHRRKGLKEPISGYTASVSMGCILRPMGLACTFCRTGNLLPFSRSLSFSEIAKQNIVMVLTDMYCSTHEQLSKNKREFAYMGQGEPGFAYAQTRLAIELTNHVMRMLKQNVHRHVLATSGVPEMIEAYKNDIASNFYSEAVTLHFSLHATDNRTQIMPINSIYPYVSVLSSLEKVYDLTNEKPCIGILLFDHYSIGRGKEPYTNDLNTMHSIFKELNPEKVRLSLCEYNASADTGISSTYPQEVAQKVLRLAKDMGFETKLFFSYGQEESAACGMLGNKPPNCVASPKWIELERYADELLIAATSEMEDCYK